MGLTWLAPGPPPSAGRPGLAGAEHESRTLLQHIDDGDGAARRRLRELYDAQAPEWADWCRTQPDYLVPLLDGLSRLGSTPAGLVVEVSAGSGQATAELQARFDRLLATDSALQMTVRLAAALPDAHCVVAESGRLPLRSGTVELIVGVNAVPDLAEFRRVLRPDGGRVLWVSSFGEETPLYVPPDTLAEGWDGPATAATAGHGDWVMLECAHAG